MTGTAHPFHVHNVQFYILDRDDGGGAVPPSATESGLKDTVLVESGETVRIIAKFEDFADDVIPYMYHCHNLIHEDNGMMGQFTVVDSSLGITETLITTVTVFPNPTTDFLNINIPNLYDVESIILYDVSGKEIFNIPNRVRSLDISDLSSGTYLLKVKTLQGEVAKKILKD